MVVLNRKLLASSLLECVVAAVILLVSFGVTMEILTRIMLSGNDAETTVMLEVSIKEVWQEYRNGTGLPGKYSRKYDWGTVEVEVSEYLAPLQHLIIIAVPAKGSRTVRYDYLIKKNENED